LYKLISFEKNARSAQVWKKSFRRTES